MSIGSWALKNVSYDILKEGVSLVLSKMPDLMGTFKVEFVVADHLILYKYGDSFELAPLDWREILKNADMKDLKYNLRARQWWYSDGVAVEWTPEFVSKLFFEGAWDSGDFKDFLSGKLFKIEKVDIDEIDLEMFYKRWLVSFTCGN